ncbi:Hypothetical protein POVR2_LOCUS264, partial [uncultured virus]
VEEVRYASTSDREVLVLIVEVARYASTREEADVLIVEEVRYASTSDREVLVLIVEVARYASTREEGAIVSIVEVVRYVSIRRGEGTVQYVVLRDQLMQSLLVQLRRED